MLGEKPESEYTIIYNGVDKEIFYPAYENGFNKPEKIKFITTGHFRNPDMLIPIVKALDIIKKQFEFTLTIIGPITNPDLNSFLNRDYIYYIGEKSLDDVAKLLRESHIYLFSSLNPPCPNSVIEAISSALPVVGFDDGAMKEILWFSKELLAFTGDEIFKKPEYLDPRSFSEKILYCVENYFYFRQKAFENSKLYSIEECVSSYIKVFGSCKK
jgi:glycosyltransferase involved in cell wall biosynthesis